MLEFAAKLYVIEKLVGIALAVLLIVIGLTLVGIDKLVVWQRRRKKR